MPNEPQKPESELSTDELDDVSGGLNVAYPPGPPIRQVTVELPPGPPVKIGVPPGPCKIG